MTFGPMAASSRADRNLSRKPVFTTVEWPFIKNTASCRWAFVKASGLTYVGSGISWLSVEQKRVQPNLYMKTIDSSRPKWSSFTGAVLTKG